MYKVRLTKIESNHNNLRTDTIEGCTAKLPQVREPFCMYAEPIDPDASVRFIKTTLVAEITSPVVGEFEFKTKNSTYRLTVLEHS